MAEFTLDFSKADDGSIKDGTYEAVISSVKEDAAKTGTEFLNFDVVVRNDIDQKYKNAHVFQKVWRSKETGKYNQGRLMAIAKAAGMQDGKHYTSFEDFCNDFTGQPVKITVRNSTREYQGKTYDDTEIRRYEVSEFPDVQHKWPAGMTPNQPTPTVADNDLPF